uniref:Uncharacterized protein n=1 Tax=Catagonus wagneri TaxID=51154 RepID=A0A8C3X383_9CETA
MGDQAGLLTGRMKPAGERLRTRSDTRSTRPRRSSRRQGLQAGSPPPLPGTRRTGGCRAPGWPTPPAPRKTCSPATRRPPSSKRSARSSCGSPRNRAPCRTSTADRPCASQICQVSASCGSQAGRKSAERAFGRGRASPGPRARGREQVAILEEGHESCDSPSCFFLPVGGFRDHLGLS